MLIPGVSYALGYSSSEHASLIRIQLIILMFRLKTIDLGRFLFSFKYLNLYDETSNNCKLVITEFSDPFLIIFFTSTGCEYFKFVICNLECLQFVAQGIGMF
jgi:hypothetical protein